LTEIDYKIMKKVYEKYPKTEGEKKCREEREILERLRAKYKKELEDVQRDRKEGV